MGSGMPEIGSRISLISKADIRYEGKLFSVDPEECTIALSSVRSYGTEDRETQYRVPAQDQVYDYILFRGTDIKDIRVLSTTIPNDPAIVQLSVPPSLNDSQFPTRTGYPPQPAMTSMSMPNAPSTSRDQSQGFPGSFAGAVSSKTSALDLISKSQSTQNAVSEDDSRSSTPSTHNVKSNDTNARVSIGSNAEDASLSSRKPNNYSRDRPMSGNRYQQAPRQQYQQYQQRYQQPRYQNHQSQQQQSQPRYMQQQQQQQHQQQSHYRDYNRDNQHRNYNNDYRDSYGNRQYMQPMRNQQRDGWTNFDQRNNRNRMNQNTQQRINYQSTGYQNQNRKPKNTLKFENDYDFEQANTEFEQMRSQLESTKLNDGPVETPTPVKMNGDVDSKKEDHQNEAGSGAEENDVDGEDKPIFYDKVKSFFDQISYEAIERSKGLTARMDWKTERKINSETFGPLALRRNGNFHGGRVGQNGGNYYNHQNRNPNNMGNNNYRARYNNRPPLQQPQQKLPNQQRRPFISNAANKPQETVEARTT